MRAITEWVGEHRPCLGAQGDDYVTLNKGDIPNDQIRLSPLKIGDKPKK